MNNLDLLFNSIEYTYGVDKPTLQTLYRRLYKEATTIRVMHSIKAEIVATRWIDDKFLSPEQSLCNLVRVCPKSWELTRPVMGTAIPGSYPSFTPYNLSGDHEYTDGVTTGFLINNPGIALRCTHGTLLTHEAEDLFRMIRVYSPPSLSPGCNDRVIIGMEDHEQISNIRIHVIKDILNFIQEQLKPRSNT